MRKLIFTLICIVGFSAALVSCGDDDDVLQDVEQLQTCPDPPGCG